MPTNIIISIKSMTTSHDVTDLLDGLVWIKKTYPLFDYIVVDCETIVYFKDFDSYLKEVNECYYNFFGHYYPNL